MRTLFLGNHTVGTVVLQELFANTHVQGVVAHPSDIEDGVRYISVYDQARQLGLPVIRGDSRTQDVQRFILGHDIDLLWVTDYRYIIPPVVLNHARRGGVNLHPGLLPQYRGRASLNWALINGESTVGLTAHLLDVEADTGDIIKQIAIPISDDEYISDVLTRLYPLYSSLTHDVLQQFHDGPVVGKPQNHTLASAFPARTPADGRINWRSTSRNIRNHVRAVSHPYPGAFSTTSSYRVRIWRADIAQPDLQSSRPGTILAVDDSTLTVKCGDGSLLVNSYEIRGTTPRIGDVLE